MSRIAYRLALNLKGKLQVWEKPLVMGIVNATPDSFYENSRVETEQQVVAKVGEMLEQGADIIDVGGQSSRPGSNPVSASEELDRVVPFVEQLVKQFPHIILSIDTFYAEVAEVCLKAGAHIINDISAGDSDRNMLATVARHKAPYIAMHKKGEPKTMQQNPEYEDVCAEVIRYLADKVEQSQKAGIIDVIADVGFGFGKTTLHNYELFRNLNAFKNVLQVPLLVGISRKAMIWKTLGITPQESLPATNALHLLALQQGADILRAHDVKEAIRVRTLWTEWLNPLHLHPEKGYNK